MKKSQGLHIGGNGKFHEFDQAMKIEEEREEKMELWRKLQKIEELKGSTVEQYEAIINFTYNQIKNVR